MKKILRPAALLGLIVGALMMMGFTDLPEDHWAYGAVRTLVDEGTVSGMPDGGFHPDDPVTRAQFVKMLGYRLAEPRNDYIVDLRRLHWAYDYLLHSPLRLAEGRKLLPDALMTREQAAVYMYDCYAGGESSYAPSFVTAGSDYPTEVGWTYEHGIMTGDDGVDLRLDAGLTRAEAAALIVKSRGRSVEPTDFADNIAEEKLERVFNGSDLFDVPYDSGAVLTNGQIARAACRLKLDRINALWYDENADFDHQYANDLKTMEFVLGPGRISANFADAPAAAEDTVAMLSYGVAHKIHAPVPYGGRESNFLDAAPVDAALVPALTFAWKNGIRPCGGGKLNDGEPVTHRYVASFLLQCDILWGLQTSVTVSGTELTYNDEPMRLSGLPAKAGLYQSVLASVPNAVFDLPFLSPDGKEMELASPLWINYPFYNDLRDAFTSYLSDISLRLSEERGATVIFTYYPQLVYDNSSGFTLRVRAEVNGAKPTADMLGGRVVYNEGVSGNVVWVEYPLSYMFFME